MTIRKFLYILFPVLALSACSALAKDYVIGFYNVENLFDTEDDPHRNDNDYLPDGTYEWTQDKYEKKLDNIARVIKSMASENGGKYHSVLGLAEVENRRVLQDLVARKDLKKAGYKIVHYESPDSRGIDCALLYRPSEFKLQDSEVIKFDPVNTPVPVDKQYRQSDYRTRHILVVRGTIEGEQFAVYVAHLPSRLGGKGGDLRSVGAEQIHSHAMALMKKYPGIKIVVMGDMNDDPTDESQVKWLHARETIEKTGAQDFFNPFIKMLRDGYGSLEYQGKWNIFDNIEVNSNLASSKGLHIKQADRKGHYGAVYNPSFLTQQSGRYKGTPFRSFSGGKFIDGYSDHYPTYIIIGK